MRAKYLRFVLRCYAGTSDIFTNRLLAGPVLLKGVPPLATRHFFKRRQ